MGYRSSSTRRTSAASAVSSQAVVVNTGTGFSAVGSTVRANTSISLGVTTVGQTSASTVTTVSAGPVISNVAYLDANNSVTSANAVSTSGGNVRITGTGFVANSAIYINNTLATNTFVSSTQIIATCPAASAGNVAIMIFTPTDAGTQRANAVRYSGAPTWTTAAAALQNGIVANVSLVASSDSTLTYTLQDGSTLPTGISLNSAGYLTGTPTGYSGSASVTVVIIATDAEGQATQQTITISITTGDDQFKYTSLLLNGETSVTPFIKDSSSNNFGLTLAGDVRADRFSPYYGNGYYSNSFSATPDYYLLPASANLAFAGDYTLECWVYLNSVTGTQGVYSSIDNSGDTWAGIYIGFSGTSFLATSYISSADTITHQTAVAVGQWYHLAMVRSGSSTKSYLNGVQSTGTTSSSYSLTQSGSSIGTAYPGSSPLNGYISNLRIVKGTALYTANFTPPTEPLTAISGTQLLTCQSNRAVDVSSNAFTLTATGTPRVSTAIPFAASSSYATYGSAYFDGTGDYITTPGNTAFDMGTGDFTIECFVTTNGYAGSQYGRGIFALYPSGNYNNRIIIRHTTADNRLNLYGAAGGSPYLGTSGTDGTTALKVGTWNHIALVRQSGVFRVYINGVQDIIISNQTAVSLASSNCFDIGRTQEGSIPDWNGRIADFRVVKGTAVYTSNFTPPTAPLAAISGTSLLSLQYNGSVNNSVIVDNGPFNNVITRAGNATQGTFSPYSQTGWSVNFNRSRVDSTLTGKSPGTGSFTYELFFNVTIKDAAIANVAALFSTRGGGTGADGFDVQITTAGAVQIGTSGSILFTSSNSLVTNGLWHHLAIVRNGTTNWAVYLNGSSIGTLSNATNFTSVNLYLGVFGGTGQDWFKGYISNFRYTRDAVYTSNFTPSITPLAVIANTEFLSCQSNRHKDNSANNFAVTPVAVNGSSSIQAFSPFSPSAAYTPSLHGGSAYFDGTGDYLTVGTFAPGSNNFTVEFWFYCTALPASGQQGIFLATPWGGNNFQTYIKDDSTIIWQAYTQNNTGVAVKLNQWYHVAIVKNGSTGYFYINGVQQNTATLTNSISGTATVGAREGGIFFTGYISDMRVSIGTTVYTGAFTPPTAPLTSSTATPSNLLLNFTNGGLVDQHSSNNLETVGNAQVSTAVKKYGNSSMYFDGNGDWLQFPSSNTIAFSTGDFTVECWLNFTSSNGTYNPFVRYDGSGTFDFGYDFSTTQLKHSGAGAIFAVTQSFTPGTWYHVALTRASGSCRMFVNGTQVGSTVTGNTDNYAAGAFKVGGSSYSGSHVMNGYIDDLRITRGFARYTANFTAPTTALLGQ